MNSECFYIESLDQVQADVCDHVNECFMSIMWPQGHLYHISELLMRTTVESKGWSVESLLPPVTFIEVKNRSYFQVSVLWFTLYNMGGGGTRLFRFNVCTQKACSVKSAFSLIIMCTWVSGGTAHDIPELQAWNFC